MKSIFAMLLMVALGWQTQAQNHHLTAVSNLPYADQLSNIWGYVHTDGTEYALVGTDNGTSIVSLADPANPVEVAFVDGTNSIWRELRTWGTRAYVVSDNTEDGLLIIDLSQLPTVTHQFIHPTLTINGNTDSLLSVHTIHIDEQGYGYLMGSNLGVGQTLIFDVAANPTNPVFLGAAGDFYAHDSYTRNDTLYTSDIYDGFFSVYDISDRTAPVLVAQQTTPFSFTHNTWLSDDSHTIFTTDERANAYVAAYDISDINNIVELDRFRPFETEGLGVIPHNAHVNDDYVYVSHYTDGLIVLDGSRPSNLVEVGKYDSYLGADGGFSGNWGVYPYLPSGLIIISDMQTGLHVLQPSLQRACWLEGLVTELGTGNILANVAIEITTTPIYTNSEIDGEYRTGIAQAGTYDVTFIKAGYVPKTVSVVLQNGQVTVENVELEPAVPFNYSGNVVEIGTNTGIAGAAVRFKSNLYDYTVNTDANGDFTVVNMYADAYTVMAGAWGYHTIETSSQQVQQGTSPATYELETGYRDEFALDLGWTVSGNATTGVWERGFSPGGVYNQQGWNIVPDGDIASDLGDLCYVTGNQDNQTPAADDVDGGVTTLSSPIFDLNDYTAPYINFNYWWVNEGGNGAPNDTLVVEISNGITTARLAQYNASLYAWSATQSFLVSDFINPTATMQLHFRTSDIPALGGHIVESGLDNFEVTDGAPLSVGNILDNNALCRLSPNPFSQELRLEYQDIPNNSQLAVFNALGQCIHTQNIDNQTGMISLGQDWQAGIYWIKLANQTYPVVKK